MSHTIESFVTKLQTEGIEVGRREAEKIVAKAHVDAERITRSAQDAAEQLIDVAEGQAEFIRRQVETELKLAVRDAIRRLHHAVITTVERLLEERTEELLLDPDFLGVLIREVVIAYASSDASGKSPPEVYVQPPMRQELAKRLLSNLATEKMQLIGRDSLKEAGFEYSTSDSIVEVSMSAVVETLAAMVRPDLQKLLQEALHSTNGSSAGKDGRTGNPSENEILLPLDGTPCP